MEYLAQDHSRGGPGLAFGPLPIGVLAAPTSVGPIGIGIGVPLMTGPSFGPTVPITCPPTSLPVHQVPPMYPDPSGVSRGPIVSPDSSDNRFPFPRFIHHSNNYQNIGPVATASSQNPSSLIWSNQIFQPMSGFDAQTRSSGDLNFVCGQSFNPVKSKPSSMEGSMSLQPQSIFSIPQRSQEHGMDFGEPSLENFGKSSSDTVAQPISERSGLKEVIQCKSCTLIPPTPEAPTPSTREVPPGCRTVFVGGLPEGATEGMIHEIFDRCGEISTVRMSKKNFCHIRFQAGSALEQAIYFSGYQMRIGVVNSETANIGRLHVDYAQARDDQYEWECRQRQCQREARHRERLEQQRSSTPPSPPPIVLYSENEASELAEKIKAEDSFMKASQILITWLDRGDCSKRTSSSFYSLIQSTNGHSRRLLAEKLTFEEEFRKAQELIKQRMKGLLVQYDQIEKILIASTHKKAWDHFTKAQRKNIDAWKKQASEAKQGQFVQVLQKIEKGLDEEVMTETSDSENSNEGNNNNRPGGVPNPKRRRTLEDDKLKEENEYLKSQLEMLTRENCLMRNALDEKLIPNGLASVAQQNCEVGFEFEGIKMETTLASSTHDCDSSTLERTSTTGHATRPVPNRMSTSEFPSSSSTAQNHLIGITEREARLLGVISAFLHVHPFGASIDYIRSYAEKVEESSVSVGQVMDLLQKFPNLFQEELSGVGASLERKWFFHGFQQIQSSSK